MAKDKPPKTKGVPNKHLHARTTFLYQAATYLTLHSATGASASVPSSLALQLGSDLQIVSRKSQVRLSADLKRTICKTCNTVLIPGRTATHTVENDSKGGKKPWADVLVVGCTFCGAKKRFPVGATKQQSKAERKLKAPSSVEEQSLASAQQTTPTTTPTTSV
ncbi:Rpr2-domain-containing protein [Periconia macrospinosa]|uniref:Rpr2-domain-containing protein n=1 Tax=Periconia macrospinosa TaxID=97972 RepID=A0A2V1E6W8_9PLEO|nr:Rpr2-domain-containing protein [Periconia macrospinosa]